jgi:hypothetical protein
LLSGVKLRNLFSPGLREHTKALIRFCIDTMYEVALYDYTQDPKAAPKGKKKGDSIDFQMCTGAKYLLIKVIGYIMKDQKIEEEFLWAQVSEVEGIVQKVPLALKLGDAILKLLFKPGYTIRDVAAVPK